MQLHWRMDPETGESYLAFEPDMFPDEVGRTAMELLMSWQPRARETPEEFVSRAVQTAIAFWAELHRVDHVVRAPEREE